MIPTFLSGAIGIRLPDHHAWISVYGVDLKTKLLLSFTKHLSLATDTAWVHIHYINHQPSHIGQLYDDSGILFVRDLFNNDDKYSAASRSSPLAKYCICCVPFRAYCWLFECILDICSSLSSFLLASSFQSLY